MVNLSGYFEGFLENISLGDPQVPRMDSAAQTVSEFLIDSYGLSPSDVYLQGSYANGTAIEPVDGGAYDVDIVCVCVRTAMSADDALDDLERRFRSDGRYRDRVTSKKPCVRLEYADDNVGSFHVDVVPVSPTAQSPPPVQVPRRGEGWHGSAPAEYTAWCVNRGDAYVRTVKAAKRWRDEQQSVRQAVKSIVLQVLVGAYMSPHGDDAERLATTFTAMRDAFASMTTPPRVMNPVLPGENLAARWTRSSFDSFKSELEEAAEWATKARATPDPVEAADAWRFLLGDDFPISSPDQLGYCLGDISHAASFAARGWTEQLDPSYGVVITAEMLRGPRGRAHQLHPNSQLVFAGYKLHFRAQLRAPRHVEVYWQVANTGAHARENNGLRGEFFKGRDLKNRPTVQTENWEDTAYTGAHVIRVVVVRSNRVVAKSGWYTVNVYSKAKSFRL